MSSAHTSLMYLHRQQNRHSQLLASLLDAVMVAERMHPPATVHALAQGERVTDAAVVQGVATQVLQLSHSAHISRDMAKLDFAP